MVTVIEGCKANFGLPPEIELSYERLLEVIDPEDRPAMQDAVQRVIATGTDY